MEALHTSTLRFHCDARPQVITKTDNLFVTRTNERRSAKPEDFPMYSSNNIYCVVELGTLEPTPREDAVVVVLVALLALHEKNSKCLIYHM